MPCGLAERIARTNARLDRKTLRIDSVCGQLSVRNGMDCLTSSREFEALLKDFQGDNNLPQTSAPDVLTIAKHIHDELVRSDSKGLLEVPVLRAGTYTSSQVRPSSLQLPPSGRRPLRPCLAGCLLALTKSAYGCGGSWRHSPSSLIIMECDTGARGRVGLQSHRHIRPTCPGHGKQWSRAPRSSFAM